MEKLSPYQMKNEIKQFFHFLTSPSLLLLNEQNNQTILNGLDLEIDNELNQMVYLLNQ